MKKHLFPLAILAAATCINSSSAFAAPDGFPDDSLPVLHKHDGMTDEWRSEQFTEDAETSIRYAIENDATDIYLALIIPNTATQIKMMRSGMNVYFDLKAKKRESRGIGFPVKPEGEAVAGGGFGNRSGGGREPSQEMNGETDRSNGQPMEKRGPDMKRMRMMMATHLMSMHLFGFSEGDPVDQGLERENSAQIAFTWDTSEVWHIEYKIPLSLFGDPATLDQHLMTIGFKLNGIEMNASSGGADGGGFGSRGGGGFGGRSGGGGPGSRGAGGGNPVDFQKMMKEQSFWTKYTFIMKPVAQKAF